MVCKFESLTKPGYFIYTEGTYGEIPKLGFYAFITDIHHCIQISLVLSLEEF